jgi:hypothetical protein
MLSDVVPAFLAEAARPHCFRTAVSVASDVTSGGEQLYPTFDDFGFEAERHNLRLNTAGSVASDVVSVFTTVTCTSTLLILRRTGY